MDDVNENVVTMEMNTLMEKATDNLKIVDYQAYGLGGQQLEVYIEKYL